MTISGWGMLGVLVGAVVVAGRGYGDWQKTGMESRFLLPLLVALGLAVLFLGMGYLSLIDRWQTRREQRKLGSEHERDGTPSGRRKP